MSDSATQRNDKQEGDIYRCLEDGCHESFRHKAKAAKHAREHSPTVGNYGIYDFIEIIPRSERAGGEQ